MPKHPNKKKRKMEKEAFELGEAAFSKGLRMLPVADTRLKALMKRFNPENVVGGSLPILKAWNAGWTKANLAKPVSEDTTSAAVAAFTPQAFSKGRKERRKKLATEMVVMGLSANVVVEDRDFDHLAYIWEALRDNLVTWANEVTKAVAPTHPGFGRFVWEGQIASCGRSIVVDFLSESPEARNCTTVPRLRTTILYREEMDIFQATFNLIDGHCEPVAEAVCEAFELMEFGIAGPVMNTFPNSMRQPTNPNVSHDAQMSKDAGMAMSIVRGERSARDLVMGV